MVSLVDIAPLKQSVPINGQSIDVVGVSAEGFANILQRFPEVKLMFTGRAQEITTERLYKLGPEAIKAIIAAGCGMPGDETAETKAASLVIGDQMDLIDAIIKMTLPSGPGPFFEKLTALIPKDILEKAAEEYGKGVATK